MNSKIAKIIGVVVILILVGVFFAFSKKSTSDVMQKPTESVEKEAGRMKVDGKMEKIKGNIFDLVKAGKDLKCTYSVTGEDYMMQGTSYISGQKVRVDSTTNLNNKEAIESHMISDGTWVYTWTNATPQGMKMKIEDAQGSMEKPNMPQGEDKLDSQAQSLDQNYDYDCESWNESSSMFELPVDVQFSDLSELMMPSSGSQDSACAACNYIQDASAKEQCKTSLNCQ